MSPDIYLGFAALFISYFLKVAVACLLCWILAALAKTPRQRFAFWLMFLLGSVAYWLYAIGNFSLSTLSAGSGGTIAHAVSTTPHQFLLPTKFQYATLLLGRILGSAYLLGVLLLFVTGVWKRVRLRFVLRQASAPSVMLQQMFSEMCRHFGIRHCELSVLAGISSPATVYWWRPRIVLPQACVQMDDRNVMPDILSHELAHVARRDYLWSSISDVVCGLLFFHPAVWQARKQMRIHREMACDLAVVSARPEHRADYAETLTRIARLSLPRKYPVIGIDFAAAPSLLRNRVEAILDDPQKNSRMRRLARGLAGAALIGVYGFICSVLAVAIAFAPSAQPRSVANISSSNAHTTSVTAHKARRLRAQPEAEYIVAESPAYRLPSNSASPAYLPESSAGNEQQGVAGSDSGSSSIRPVSGRSVSVGRTVESIIVSTVGTVLGGDKDDHTAKKK